MGRMLGTFVASATMALLHVTGWSTPVRAQETDGRFLVGAGLEPLALAWTQTKIDGRPSETTRRMHAGPSGEILLAVGYGLGAWVLALEVAFGNTTETSESVDIVTSASRTEHTVSRTSVVIGQSARLLFGETAVHPFVEAAVGLAIERLTADDSDSDSLALFVRGGPGLQLRLADPVSIDVSLRLGYIGASGTIDPDARILVVDPVGGEAEAGPSDFSSQVIELSTAARLSVWL